MIANSYLLPILSLMSCLTNTLWYQATLNFTSLTSPREGTRACFIPEYYQATYSGRIIVIINHKIIYNTGSKSNLFTHLRWLQTPRKKLYFYWKLFQWLRCYKIWYFHSADAPCNLASYIFFLSSLSLIHWLLIICRVVRKDKNISWSYNSDNHIWHS